MIETIYNAENDKRKEWKKSNYIFRMPKNIRQIGQAGGNKKIYLEDYVSTYVKQLAKKGDASCKMAVLLGQLVKMEENNHIFICGAIEVKTESSEEIEFTNEDWSSIYENIKKFFTEVEVVGWFLTMPGLDLVPSKKVTKLHMDNFAGQDKTLLLYDNVESEEAFYICQGNQLCRQNGYYIYYERNPQMQNYMIERGGMAREETQYDDKVSRKIRTVLKEKQEGEEGQRGATNIIYAVGTLLAVVLLFIGGAVFRNYDQMQNMQEAINVISDHVLGGLVTKETGNKIEPMIRPTSSPDAKGNMQDTKEADKKQETKVNTITGNVTTIKGNKIVGETKKNKETIKPKETAKPIEKPSGKATEKPIAKATKKPVDKAKTTETNGKATEAKADNKTVPAPVYYIVKKGDTLDGISYRFYGTRKNINTIKNANQIKDQDFIREGRKLLIP